MAGGLIAAIVHFAPQPLLRHGPELGAFYSGLMMGLVALLSVLMVSTVRYSSFKTVGTDRRSTRIAILIVAAIGMLVWLYSRYVVLALVSLYVLHGIVLRLAALFRSARGK